MNPVVLLIKRGWQCAAELRRNMKLYVFMYFLAQLLALAEPWVIGSMLNAVQADIASGATQQVLWHIKMYLGMYLGIQFFFWMLHGPARLIERATAFEIANRYKAHMFYCLTHLPLSWHRQHHSGESIDHINRATSAISGFFQNGFDLIYMVLRLIGTLIVLYCFMPLSVLACAGMAVVAGVVVALVDRVLNKQYEALNKKESFLASAFHDYISNIVSVITLRLEGRSLTEVEHRLAGRRELFRSSAALNEGKWFASAMLISLMIVVVLFFYARGLTLAGHPLLAGTFFTLFEYLRRIGDSFYRFTSYYGVVVRQSVDLQSAEHILRDYEATLPVPGEAALPTGWRRVAVANLCFTYEDGERQTHQLQDVGINLELGKSIAVVGASGSGKSTLLTLLRGLQPPSKVEISADGVKLEKGLRHLSGVTALMPQNPEIFADTIRFNITFGMQASDDEIAEVVALARFDEVLARLPKGLDTNIAEKGVNLSGGEKQRLALARGIFFARDKQIVLLDEPTSSVDTENEREIYRSLLQRFGTSCLVSAIHKLHLLELFDSIYVLEDGKVVEQGDFKALTEGDGVLATAWKAYQIER